MSKAQYIDKMSGFVSNKTVHVNASPLLNWVAVSPATETCAVIAVAIVAQPHFRVVVLGRKPKWIGRRKWSRGADDLTERVVFVGGGDRAVGPADEADDIAHVVVRRELCAVRGVVDGHQPAHAARALQAATEVQAPNIATNEIVVGGVEF